MADPPVCWCCGRDPRPPHRRPRKEPEAISRLKGTPSPPGDYTWGGKRYRRDWARIAPLLGRAPDEVLARTISVGAAMVRKMRARLEIPAYDKLRGLEHLLGKETDYAIARRSGLHPETVRKRRTKLGIARASIKKVNADRLLTGYLDELDRFFNE